MALEQIWNENYEDFLESEKGVLIVGATWCPDCIGYHEIIEYVRGKSDAKNHGIRYGEVVLDDKERRASDIKKDIGPYIRFEIPATFFFKDGKLEYAYTGVRDNGFVRWKLENHLGVSFS